MDLQRSIQELSVPYYRSYKRTPVASGVWRRRLGAGLFGRCCQIVIRCNQSILRGLLWRAYLSMAWKQEGGLPLLLHLARAPLRGARPPSTLAGKMGTSSTGTSPGGAVTSVGDWEVFALAVRLLRRTCMLAANRSELLALKVREGGREGVTVLAIIMLWIVKLLT